MTVKSSCLGMPHIGASGEICEAVSDFVRSGFKTKSSFELLCKEIRKANWQAQIDAGIDMIPCNDFTTYDSTLDTTTLVGNIPRRYYWEGGLVPPDIYFSMIKGQQKDKFDVHGMPSRAWFNTGYSYMVPEITGPINFAYSDNKAIAHFLEAKKLFGISSVVTLLGPVSYMMLSDHNFDDGSNPSRSAVISKLLNVYLELLQNLTRLNASDIRFEEPFLVKDLTREEQSVYRECYSKLREIVGGRINLHIVTSFGSLGNNLECTMSLGCKSVHYDFVNGEDDLDEILSALPDETSLSMGLVNAGNIWVTDIEKALSIAGHACKKIGKERVIVSPSSSLSFCPLDKKIDTTANAVYAPFLSFATDKLREVVLITNILNNGREAFAKELADNAKTVEGLSQLSGNINNKLEASATSALSGDLRKRLPFRERKAIQSSALKKDLILPLTDVGAAPSERSLWSSDEVSDNLKSAILENIRSQERYLDLVTTGEIERRNNVEYFADLIGGIEVTPAKVSRISGSSYLHRPTIYDISSNVNSHYLKVAEYCLSVAVKPIRFSLIGPISLVNSSFVPEGVDTFKCYTHFATVVGRQIRELQRLGYKHIMIDEPNLLQHMPLRSEQISQYVRKLADIFKIATSYADDSVQLCLHIKDLPFAEYIESISNFDVDVLFLTSASSKLEVLDAFVSYKYPNDVALGLFNADSARIPTKSEINSNLRRCLRVLEEEQMWITTDTGTRGRTRKDVSSIYSIMSSVTQDVRKSIS